MEEKRKSLEEYYKDFGTKDILDNVVSMWFNTLTNAGLDIVCFAEDFLAVRLLHKKECVKWLSVIGTSDTYFLETAVDGYLHNEYASIVKKTVNSELIDKAVRKYKAGKVEDYIDREAFLGARLSVLQRRIKDVTEDILKTVKIIVYINTRNNYCKIPTAEVGDGRLVITVDALTGVTCYMFGGIPVNREEFKTILGGLSE